MNIDLNYICKNFQILGEFVSGEPYGSGHINDTFAVTLSQGGTPVRYILQRINETIFKDPVALMDNIKRVTEHQQKRIESDNSRSALTVLPDLDGNPYFLDKDGKYWRCYIFVENSKTYDIIETEDQAYQAAKAFGAFQENLSDLPGERLTETIVNFHNTPARFDVLHKAIDEDVCGRAKDVQDEIKFMLERESLASVLLDFHAAGKLPERITHNDTKLNNVMIDDESNEGICVIDLDTVMPGFVHYDFGDLIRTSTSPAAEDEKDLSKVCMQMNMFKALAKGYIESAGKFLTPLEKEYLPFSGKLITLEIGVRFLTDYLQGDIYFKTHREGHNLDRCRTQIKLVQSIEEQEDDMNAFIQSL